ncbi:MAG: AMP-binding protein, partial [Alcanivoracaceae bacterium]
GLVAAARLGMVVSSISPLLTAPEVRHQCQDAGVRVLLGFAPLYAHTVAPVRAELPTLAHVIITGPTDSLDPAACCDEADASQVHSFNQWLAATDCEPVPEQGDIDQVMYLQYTGGTTGLPKGAQLTARNIFTNNAQADVFYGFGVGEEVVASAFPLFHIGGAAVLFNALRQAATFFLIPDPRDLAQFCREMQQRPPTVIAAVPALYQMLLNEPDFTGQDFSQLRLAVSGAAPFSEADIARLEAVIGKQRFCEVYGMTETSPVQTLNPAERLKPGFVGIPLPGTEVRIIDPESHERMPPGEPGEIIVAGPQVMSGYLNLPEATDKALHQIDGKRWMFTGDIGFMDEDGYVRVCDRSKDMLIVGGYKVFSVEIENKLLSLPGVEMCAVVGRPDPDRAGNEIVQLHVQKTAGYSGDNDTLAESIRGYCRKNMAPYKVPREIFFPDAIPLTSVGKIDKKALRQA